GWTRMLEKHFEKGRNPFFPNLKPTEHSSPQAPAPARESGLAEEPGPPSLPPEATQMQKEAASKWMKEKFVKKLNDKDYTIQGPLGTTGGALWACSGLVHGALTNEGEWKPEYFPTSKLPVWQRGSPGVSLATIDSEIMKLGAFTRIANDNLKLENG